MGLKIYCDSGSLADIEKYGTDDRISGITTNPSILRKAGITNYRTFAKEALARANGKPLSLEVLADDWEGMHRQANEIQSWGNNVWVKIPITNSKGDSSIPFIEQHQDLQLNVTAILTHEQIMSVLPFLTEKDILSIFVGRINDTGANIPDFSQAVDIKPDILWASAREIYTLKVAEHNGYDIITLTPDLISKLSLQGKDLKEYSLETVNQFYRDGEGITL